MLSLTLISLACLARAVASPLSATYGSEQVPLDGLEKHGFDLDLSAQRLVQMEGQKPVWMTELEKVSYIITNSNIYHLNVLTQIQAKAQGIKFFDM
jgi:bacterial leucyl aminopeptidase